jgi:hypothetical protein
MQGKTYASYKYYANLKPPRKTVTPTGTIVNHAYVINQQIALIPNGCKMYTVYVHSLRGYNCLCSVFAKHRKNAHMALNAYMAKFYPNRKYKITTIPMFY